MQRAPAWGPFLFRRDRVQQRGRVIVVPDQGGEVVAVRLERNRLLIHVEIDVLERPGAELAVAKAGLEPAVRLTGGEERRCRVIDRSQDSELGFEFLDDRDRGALELELGDPATQFVDLQHVLVHASSLFKNWREEQPHPASPRGGGIHWMSEWAATMGAIRMAMILTTLIMGLIAGPAVSLLGSPTVSPVTAAAWVSVPLPP